MTRTLPSGRQRPSRSRAGVELEAEDILATVRGLSRNLLHNSHADALQHGITGPQLAVMARLVSNGPMTLSELSRSLEMSHSTASGIVDRLQARGVVRRVADTADRRRTSIEVTNDVRRYVRELEEGPVGRLVKALRKATPAERLVIKKGLAALGKLVDSERPGR